jgi:hypothetical protein
MGLGGIAETVDARHLEAVRDELREILAMLSKPAVPRTAVQPIRASRSHAHHTKPAAAAPPAPTPFPKPRLVNPAKSAARESSADAFVNGLFDDLPPLK